MSKSKIVNRDDIPVRACHPHPKNYNVHDESQITDLRLSLREFGQVASLVVQDGGDGGFLLVAGHGIWTAMVAEDFDTLRADVLPADWDEVKVIAYMAVDNELARASNPDQVQLQKLVTDVHRRGSEALARLAAGSEERLTRLLSQGQANLSDLSASHKDDPGAIDPSEELLSTWPVEFGQVWEVPSRSIPGVWHRIRCGDSTDRYGLAALMAGSKADWVFTDPPYGVDYTGGGKAKMKIQNDQSEGLEELLFGAFQAVDNFLEKGCPVYVAHCSGANSEVFFRCYRLAGWHIHQDLVWSKQSLVLGHSDYHHKHEMVLFGWPGDEGDQPVWHGEEDGKLYEVTHGQVLYGWKPGRTRPWFGGRCRVSVN